MQKVFILSFFFFLFNVEVFASPNYNRFLDFFIFPENSEKLFLYLQKDIPLSYNEQSNLQELLIEISYEYNQNKNKLFSLPPEVISKIIDNKVAKILTPKNYVAYISVKNKIIGD